jgi:hypothetical protein
MEVFRELMKKPRQSDSLAIGIFVITVLYTIYRGTAHTILVGLGFTLIVLGALPRQVALAFLVGASAILLIQTNRKSTWEGFADGKEGKEGKGGSDVPTIAEDPSAAAISEQKKREDAKDKEEEAEANDEILHGTNNAMKAKAAASVGSEGFSENKKKVMLPDNADRKEPLELGKAYKLPNENDDKGFHLDSGTTFLNAYKALKPDQIAAMTKDTQELLATQKSLVGMLESFGPLMKDMSKITGFFGPGNN